MFSQLRALREIERDSVHETSSNSAITMFFGLHNAEQYLDSILEFLRSQPDDFQILIVDNASSDSTWSKIREWPMEIVNRATLVKNPINIGATGSLALNLDLIRTPWVSTIHQDDLYLKNHVNVQVEAIRSVTPDCNCVVTDMGSLSSSGKIEAGRPRASWLLPDDSPESLFIANLRLHSVPFPAAAFRVEKLKVTPVPWHSTAMPDTEWVLKAIGPNGILHVPQITMHYRENPFSESHSLGESESQLGNFMALNRVLNSESFYQLLVSVADHDRNKFAEAVFEGLRFRIRDEARWGLISLAAAEQMALAWGYSESSSLKLINRAYAKTGSDRIEGLVSRLMDFYGIIPDTSLKIEQESLFTGLPAGHSPRRWIHNAMKLAVLLLTKLPYSLRRRTFKAVIRVANKLQKLSPWNFDWR
jgi:DNA-binding CsgD family transcriptional regulator